jgi:hypothetical protein
MKMYINEEMIRHWIGSDHDHKAEYLSLLRKLLNGQYTVEETRKEILELWEDTV